VLWAAVRRETGRRKDRVKIRDRFADGMCSGAIVDFLATAQVGRRAPEVAEEDVLSEASEWEPRERERGEMNGEA